jgi:salicylate hydroxylase
MDRYSRHLVLAGDTLRAATFYNGKRLRSSLPCTRRPRLTGPVQRVNLRARRWHYRTSKYVARQGRILIIGAGIGGLTAACALRQRGFEVAICERAAEMGEVGAGLQIGPNAVKVLRALGVLDRLLPLTSAPSNVVSLAWDDARLRFREPLAPVAERAYGDLYLTGHRADVHAVLKAGLPDASIRLGAHCTQAATHGDVAVASLADGTQIEADIIIGADGIRSAVRTALFGADTPRFTGQMAWRCIIPIERVPTQVGPAGSVRIARDEYVGWIGPNGHVICYPIRGGKLYNIFAGHVSQDWVEESWSAPSTKAELLDGYAGWNDALLSMLDQVDQCFKWGIYDREPLASWVEGRVALLGDAAHPMMPTLAQGAAISIEDGAALARCLGDGGDDLLQGLARYNEERVPRASRVQLQARQQFLNNQKKPPPPPLDRSWIFRHDAVTGADLPADFAVAPI